MDAPQPTARRPTLVLAEDHPQMAREITRLLAADFDVLAAVTDGESLLTLAVRLRPDAVVTDIGMPGMDGINAAEHLVRALPGLPVIFLSIHDDPEIIRRALRVGRAFVAKTAAGDDLVDAVHAALRGDAYLPPVKLPPPPP
ncbi:response regulator transcription factor [Luteibacter aegosomaticola]|uniref:response regulator n=1 Tax=Luteibacter aegosomaticola TaxID=2911538 RepID=UPI001FF75E35|nr:response regulator transcription factor [Luteibacter aegosomaticola]UPG91335.1 response regulator transcription factor [Luteibacter aegosomaticola]